MEKILEFMQPGCFVFVNDFSGWGKEALPAGFSWSKGGLEENCLLAPDGSRLMLQSTSLRRGNHLNVSLRRSGKEVEKVKLGDFFPEQDVVIATSGESLQFFAPVCRTKRELIRFLGKVGDFCEKHEMANYRFLDEAEDLAMWLYCHNPNRVQEKDWGI